MQAEGPVLHNRACTMAVPTTRTHEMIRSNDMPSEYSLSSSRNSRRKQVLRFRVTAALFRLSRWGGTHVSSLQVRWISQTLRQWIRRWSSSSPSAPLATPILKIALQCWQSERHASSKPMRLQGCSACLLHLPAWEVLARLPLEPLLGRAAMYLSYLSTSISISISISVSISR